LERRWQKDKKKRENFNVAVRLRTILPDQILFKVRGGKLQ